MSKHDFSDLNKPKAEPSVTMLRKPPVATVPAFTVRKAPGGWTFVRVALSSDLKSVVDAHETDPDIKAVSLEKFKIAAAKYWTSEAE